MNQFVNYRKDPMPLNMVTAQTMGELRVKYEDRVATEAFLAPLKHKSPVHYFHYLHSLRVALLGVDVAKFMHLDPKVLFYAGLLHDIGKALVPVDTLGKTQGWSAHDTEAMKPHVIRGYEMIRNRFDYTAEVVLWHHRFQLNGYPAKVPPPLHNYCLGNRVVIPYYGRILSLCDQFDAFHRVNDKQGVVKVPTGEEIHALMLRANPDQKVLLLELYAAGVFTTYIESETPVS